MSATIWTENGIIEVQDIRVGDRVWSYNEETGARELARVTDTFDRITRDMVSLEYETSDGEAITLRVTPEHPFLTVSGAFGGRGYAGGWVEAGSLKPGDSIFDMDGALPSRVKSVRFENISEKVYNFEVEGNHNYFVSDEGLLVHNGGVRKWGAGAFAGMAMWFAADNNPETRAGRPPPDYSAENSNNEGRRRSAASAGKCPGGNRGFDYDLSTDDMPFGFNSNFRPFGL